MDNRLRRFFLTSILILVSFSLLPSACQASDPPAEETATPSVVQQQNPTPASAARGQILYSANCSFCHGEKGERGAVPLKDVAGQMEDAAIAEFILKGSPEKGMPAQATLTNEQIADLVAFIRSLLRR